MRHQFSSGSFFVLRRAPPKPGPALLVESASADHPGPRAARAGADGRGGLDLSDVGCLKTLGAAGHFELDPVTLGEALEAARLDGGVVDENVFATLLRDESVTLGVVEPLHLSLCHTSDLSLRGLRSPCVLPPWWRGCPPLLAGKKKRRTNWISCGVVLGQSV